LPLKPLERLNPFALEESAGSLVAETDYYSIFLRLYVIRPTYNIKSFGFNKLRVNFPFRAGIPRQLLYIIRLKLSSITSGRFPPRGERERTEARGEKIFAVQGEVPMAK
jgi:hypothetical protein